MSARHEGDLDGAALERWLADRIEGFRGPVRITKFDVGQSNPTYRIAAASGEWVLRRKPFGALLPSAHAVEREYQVQAALAPLGYPVPRVYALCEDTSIIGAAFYLMQLVEGMNIADGALPMLSKEARRLTYHAMIDNLAALHRIDIAAAGLSGYGRPGNYFERQVARWTKQYRAAETERIEDVEKLIRWLPATLPPESGTRIVHGDYRIDNLILDPRGGRVLAVLDWELSTLGDPLSDFSYFAMSWVIPRDGRAALAGLDLRELGIPTLEELIARYCEQAQRPLIRSLDWYFAFNQFRLVGIAQGIKKRALDGNASSPRAAELASRVPEMAGRAWAFAEQFQPI